MLATEDHKSLVDRRPGAKDWNESVAMGLLKLAKSCLDYKTR